MGEKKRDQYRAKIYDLRPKKSGPVIVSFQPGDIAYTPDGHGQTEKGIKLVYLFPWAG